MWGLPGYPSLCMDTTYVLRINIESDSLICPSGRDTILCGIDPDPLVNLGLRAPTYQIPGIDTFALTPDTDSLCGVFINVTDSPWPSCGNTKTVIRTWLLHDLCGNEVICHDTLVYIDSIAPMVSFDTSNLALVTHMINGTTRQYLTDTIGMASTGCVGHGLAPYATVKDNCSAASDVSVSVQGLTSLVTFHYYGNKTITLPLWNIPGEREILVYRSTDGCGNTRMDTVVLIISDQTPATAVCHDKVNLSLTNVDQFSFMKAASMDAESEDNCGIYLILARRTDWLTACGNQDSVQTTIGDFYQHYEDWVAMDPGICQNIYERGFAPEVPFCCEDVGKEIMVEIMIIDFNCNVDKCWGVVNVEDKLPPIVVNALPDITISCNAYVQFYQDMFEQANTSAIQSAFGKYVLALSDRQTFMVQDLLCSDLINPVNRPYLDGLLTDNCGGLFSERYTLPDDGCLNSYILRQFVAVVSTDNGPKELVYATQRIHIEKCPLNVMNIILPIADTVVYDCGFTFGLDGNVTIKTNGPTLPAMLPGCGQYGIGFFDKIFEVVNGVGCYKVIRTWCIVDWCKVTSGGDWSSIAKEPGTFNFIQTIKIIDTVPPGITQISMVTDIQTVSCSGSLTAQIDATDNCGEPTVEWELRTQAGAFVTKGFGEIAAPGNLLPPGAYTLRWKATDPCNNISQVASNFTISSDAKPSLVAKSSLTTTLTPMDINNDGLIDLGMAEVWAAEFNSSSAPACGGDPNALQFRIAKGFAEDTSTVPPVNATKLQFSCADYSSDPTVIPVQFWAVDPATGGADYLNVMILLYDNSNVCANQKPPQTVSISGQIITETLEQIANVKVKVTNGINETTVSTGDAGLYEAGIPLIDHTMITPAKNSDHANGISTADLIKVQKHILGIKPIISPYKLIAADANKDQKINPIDLIQIRKVLLGKIEQFPDNQSWRFVDAGYRFNRPDRALEEEYPEYIELNSTTGREAKKNFVGIKIGDLDDNVFASLASGRSQENLILSMPDLLIKAGEIVKIPVYSGEVVEIEGLQLQFRSDVDKIQLLDIKSGLLTIDNESISLSEESDIANLSALAVEGVILEEEKPLFYLDAYVKQETYLSQALTLGSSAFPAEVYKASGQKAGIVVAFEPVESGKAALTDFMLHNRPNPFREETVIEFWLPEPQEASVRIYDPSGRMVKEIKQYYRQGQNQVSVRGEDLQPGMLYYELQTDQGQIVKRMILLE
ncbi:MAG: T9SS type A sorting domain-containing protein [Saprospiraceae bacterium]|nr:T9SS type A sorting domain-containing protein [Saprospiraceae bacterium]